MNKKIIGLSLIIGVVFLYSFSWAETAPYDAKNLVIEGYGSPNFKSNQESVTTNIDYGLRNLRVAVDPNIQYAQKLFADLNLSGPEQGGAGVVVNTATLPPTSRVAPNAPSVSVPIGRAQSSLLSPPDSSRNNPFNSTRDYYAGLLEISKRALEAYRAINWGDEQTIGENWAAYCDIQIELADYAIENLKNTGLPQSFIERGIRNAETMKAYWAEAKNNVPGAFKGQSFKSFAGKNGAIVIFDREGRAYVSLPQESRNTGAGSGTVSINPPAPRGRGTGAGSVNINPAER